MVGQLGPPRTTRQDGRILTVENPGNLLMLPHIFPDVHEQVTSVSN
jgi:hypothetical protein